MLAPLLALAACALPNPVQDRPAPGTALETRIRSAALFKNGLGFLRREGTAARAGSVRIERLPLPVHGTFWIVADPNRAALGPALARKDEIRERVEAVSLEGLLRANVGKEVVLTLGEKDSLTGTILAVPEPPLPETTDARLRGPVPAPEPADLLLFRTPGGTVGLHRSEIRRVAAASGDLAREYESRREAVSLTFDLTPRSDGPVPLSLLYLERGLTWVPSYAIDLSEPEKATLTAKAEVIDEVEDLEGTTVQFVTGFPNLRYGHVLDPIALAGDLNAFLNALARGAPDWGGGAQAQQVVTYNVMAAGGVADFGFPTAPLPAAGETAEDLFLYEQKDVTLKRGERGLYPLFSVRVPYEHVYEWSIPDTIGENPNQPPPQPGQERQEEIWHSVRLTNDSGLPWTTAPAMTMKNGALLGQDILTYAAVGAKTNVRITRALDVQGEQAEYEVSRDRNAATFYGTQYDRVRVKGEIRAMNHKREVVRLEVKKLIQGEVTKNPNEAKVAAIAKGLRQVNPNLRLVWTVPLEAGKTAETSYEYVLFVRG